MKRVVWHFPVAIAVFGALFWFSGVTVRGADMAPSILAGDRVWGWKTDDVLPGDVVAIADPLDPDSTVLRRVLAIGGQSIQFDEHAIRVGNRRLRTTAMGDMDEYVVTRETLWAKKPAVGHDWLTRFSSEPASRWSMDPVDVPDGFVFVLADDRDRAIDSRWWGPLPMASLKWTVRLRLGEAHLWRENWEWMVGTRPIGD